MKSKGGYWKRLGSFSTAVIVCIAMLALFQSTSAKPDVILSEGFESYDPGVPGGIPPDWYVHDNDGDGYTWEGYQDEYDAYEGYYYVRCHWHSYDYCDDWLVTEKVHISASGDTVQFYAKAYSSYYEESWEVWITETGYNVSDFLDNGDMIGNDSTSSTTYELYTYDIPTRYNDHDVWIAIRCTSYDAMYLCVDAFSLPNSGYFEGFEGVPPSGFPPADWMSEAVTGTDPDNNWTGSDGTDTHPAGVMPHSGSAMAQYDCYHINTDNSARLYTPLVDLSGYTNCQLTFWMYHDENYYDREDKLVIQASLDGTTWTNLSTFYRCTAGYFPDWISFTNDSSDYGKWVNYKGTRVHSGNYSVKGDPGSLYSTPHSDAWLITPRLSLSSSPGDLTFWYRAESDGYWVAFKVLVSTSADPLDFSSYTEVADINATSSTWEQASIDMSAYANQQVYIALKMYDSKSSYYYVFIDDFALDGWSDDFEPYVGWVKHTVDLSAYDGQNIYVGFLGVSDFGNSIYIDDVSITGAPAGVNIPPVAVDDSYSTPKNTTLNVPAPGVLSNDYDPDNGPSSLTAELVSGPSHGTLTFNSDGSFVYTPNTGFSGTDTFTYRAYDGANYSNVATVTIEVIAANKPPVAVNDSYSTCMNTPLSVPAPGVLGNDYDPDNDSLTAELVSGPSHGTLTLNSDGSFIYVPDTDFYGTDEFTYKAYDGADYSNVATVTIEVNAPPVVMDDSYSTCMDTALTIPAPGVLSNDYDPDRGPFDMTVELVSDVSHGTLTLNSDGSFTYVPDAGFDGTDSFTYKAYDGMCYSDVATVEICVVKVDADAGGPYDADYRTGFTVHFDSSGTYITPCYAGDVDYYWDFGDGTYSTEPNPVHSYSPAEDQFEVTVTLTVTVHTDSGDCSDTDTTTVTFHKEVPPLPHVQIISPKDGETVSGTVKIKWYAYDPAYQGREEELPIYIYYKPVDKEEVFKIAGPIANTGEYNWNTNNIAPGDYLLIVEAVGPHGIGHDSVRITIAGAGPGVGVSVRIEDTTISSDKWVKDGDTVEITAAITGTLASTFSAEDIRADLSAFNLGTSVPADSYDGFIAKWTIHNVKCKPSNGAITVKVDVAGITTGMATITADNSKPSLEIVKPTYGIYIFGIRILPIPFSKAIIIGPITAKVNVIDNFGAEKVEYYIDGELVEVVNKEPFDWKASLPAGLHELKVKAYDHAQNIDIKSISFLKLF